MDSSHCTRREALESLKSKSTSFAAAVLSAPFSETSLRNIIDATVETFVAPAIERLINTVVPALSNMLSEKVSKALASIAHRDLLRKAVAIIAVVVVVHSFVLLDSLMPVIFVFGALLTLPRACTF